MFLKALYKEDDSEGAFYAGIIAEAPNGRNEHRFVFIIISLTSTGFQPAEFVSWLVSIMRRYVDLFHIFEHLQYTIPSQVDGDFSSSKASDPMFCQFYQYHIKMHLHFTDQLDQRYFLKHFIP